LVFEFFDMDIPDYHRRTGCWGLWVRRSAVAYRRRHRRGFCIALGSGPALTLCIRLGSASCAAAAPAMRRGRQAGLS
jgi:hypothetical protein